MLRTMMTMMGGAALIVPAAARADDFTILIYETPAELALRTDAGEAGRAYWADYAAYGRSLVASGAMRGGAALHAGPATRDVQLSGYFTIAAATRAEAEALAKAAPAARRGGRAELRANLPNPTMAAAH